MAHRETAVAALVAIVVYVDCSSNTCADITKFDGVKQNTAITGTRFFTLKNQTLLGCAKQCLLRSACQSYNFELATGTCELNSKDSISLIPPEQGIYARPGVVTSDRTSIRPAIAGVCGTVSCHNNSKCIILSNGTWRCETECPDPVVTNGNITSEITNHVGSVLKIDFNLGFLYSGTAKCQPNGTWSSLSCAKECVIPPYVSDGIVKFTEMFWKVGTVLDYKCTGSKAKLGKAKCKPDSTWTEAKCISAVGSCLELQKCNSAYTDGEYWLVSDANKKPVKIYCHDMSTNEPKEFLTLPKENYVDYSDLSCTCKSTVGNCTGCQTTRFLRLWIKDFGNLKTVIGGSEHYTFINTTGHCRNILHTCIFDCIAHTYCNKSKTRDFVINTRGTGLKVDPNQKWTAEHPGSLLNPLTVNKTDSGRRILVKCHQPCQWRCPLAFTFTFVIDEDLPADIDSATVPKCLKQNL